MTAPGEKPRLSRQHMLDLLQQMIRIRRFEDKCAELYTQEKIRGFMHLYDGEEAIAVGVIPVLDKRDRIVATYREHGHALVRGVPMKVVLAEMCTGNRKAAAVAAAARCTCLTGQPISTAVTKETLLGRLPLAPVCWYQTGQLLSRRCIPPLQEN